MSERMELTERKLGREDIFRGRIVDVHVDTVELPNGETATREVVDHPGGVAVLALDGDGCVLTVTQYRYPFGRTLLEIPAGKLDSPDEDPYEAGLRELREETGAVEFTIRPVCAYSVRGKTGTHKSAEEETFGMLFMADITSFEALHCEIEAILVTDRPVDRWTYPLIQPRLLAEARNRGFW